MKSGNFDHASVALYEEALEQAPTLPLHCEIYWTAYRAIETMRPVGMASGRLRWDDTMTYADRYKLHLHEAEELWFIIKSLDDVMLETREEKADKSPST
jgi:hypothetical protein